GTCLSGGAVGEPPLCDRLSGTHPVLYGSKRYQPGPGHGPACAGTGSAQQRDVFPAGPTAGNRQPPGGSGGVRRKIATTGLRPPTGPGSLPGPAIRTAGRVGAGRPVL